MGLYELTRRAIILSKRNFFIRNYNYITRNYSYTGIERKYCRRKAKKIIKNMVLDHSSLWEFIQTLDLFYQSVHKETNCVCTIIDAKHIITVRRFSTEDQTFQIDLESNGTKLVIQTTANKLVADFKTDTFMYHTILDECKDERIYQQIEDFVKYLFYKVYCYNSKCTYNYDVL